MTGLNHDVPDTLIAHFTYGFIPAVNLNIDLFFSLSMGKASTFIYEC